MDELDDFQLDEETLKQIEEEAQLLAEKELRDADVLKDIEESALQDADRDDLELDDDLLKEIEAEVLAMDLGDLDDELLSDLDDDAAKAPALDVEKPVAAKPHGKPARGKKKAAAKPKAEAAESGTTAKRQAVVKAKAAALNKAKRAAISKAKQRASSRARRVAKRRIVATQTEVESQKSERRKILMLVGVFVVVMALLFIGIASLESSKAPQKPKVNIQLGVQASKGATEEVQRQKAYDAVRKEVRTVTKTQSPENIRKAIALLEEFKQKEPTYADKCDHKIDAFKRALNFVSGEAGGGEAGQ